MKLCNGWSEQKILSLRAEIEIRMSKKRLIHTLAVEEMAARLADMYCPDSRDIVRVAALLHDITKELSLDGQIELCQKYSIAIEAGDELAPKVFHAKTAAAVIPDQFPDFADSRVIGCVRWHTTGRCGMSIEEKLVYLADYIDMSRDFRDCVLLREYFFGADPENMSGSERLMHLERTLLRSYDMTISTLLEDCALISPDTILARNETAIKLIKKKYDLTKGY